MLVIAADVAVGVGGGRRSEGEVPVRRITSACLGTVSLGREVGKEKEGGDRGWEGMKRKGGGNMV